LYVGELLPEVNEAMLFELFSQVGPVASIRICRDAITRRSLGYAYVNFHNVQDCERALDSLNYTPIKGQPCRMMWSQRDPSLRRSGTGNIFIKNLDPSIDNKALHDTFTAFGNILSCKIALDDHGVSRGYGFVHFETQEAAELAIEKVNGMLLNDRQVFVGRHLSKKERIQGMEALRAQFTNVFVKNLDESVTDEDVKKLFSVYGEVSSAVVQRDQEGRSKLFGFVNFVSHEAAQQAVEALNGTTQKGKTIYVGRAQKRTERDEELRRQFEAFKLERMSKFTGVNLYVKNLSEGVNDEQLRGEFEKYGTITSCKVMTDEKGNSRGFGFVCFSSPEESQRAMTELNGRMMGGKPLYVSMAQRKDERRAQLEAQYSARAAQMRMQQQAVASTGMNIFQQGHLFYPQAVPGAPGARYPGGFAPRQAGPIVALPPGAMPPGSIPMRGARPYRGGAYRGGMNNGPQGSPSLPGQPPANNGNRRFYNRQPFSGAPGNMVPSGFRRHGPMIPQSHVEPTVLSAASLISATSEQRKQMIGDRLYPLVQARLISLDVQGLANPELLPGKITGMLLELSNEEVLGLLETPEALTEKVHEAVDVLRQHASASHK
jgi:polyadenylate-binding protein